MLISVKSKKVLDLKKRIIRDIDPEDKFNFHLDVNYLMGIDFKDIETYFVDITGGLAEKNKLVRMLSHSLNPTNKIIVLTGLDGSGIKTCTQLIRNIFGPLCLDLKPHMFKKGIIRRDLDLYCFKTHKVFIIEDFEDWEHLDQHFLKSIINYDKMTIKKPKHNCEGCIPECTIYFTTSKHLPMNIEIDDQLDVIEFCGIFDRADDPYVENIQNKTDEVFTLITNSLLTRPKLEKRLSKSARLSKTISHMFLKNDI